MSERKPSLLEMQQQQSAQLEQLGVDTAAFRSTGATPARPPASGGSTDVRSPASTSSATPQGTATPDARPFGTFEAAGLERLANGVAESGSFNGAKRRSSVSLEDSVTPKQRDMKRASKDRFNFEERQPSTPPRSRPADCLRRDSVRSHGSRRRSSVRFNEEVIVEEGDDDAPEGEAAVTPPRYAASDVSPAGPAGPGGESPEAASPDGKTDYAAVLRQQQQELDSAMGDLVVGAAKERMRRSSQTRSAEELLHTYDQ